MVDAYDPRRHGGTGQPVDWTRAAAIAGRERLVLAGGLNADNVAEAISRVRPYGIDVSSGVEDAPGIKSAARLQAFVAAVRRITHEAHA
jgi:phosphoribosylanthranilate isomerase